MSLIKTVIALIDSRGPSDADTLLPDCHGHTREQVIRALQNAACAGLLQVIRHRSTGKGRLPSVYALAERTVVAAPSRRIASVWQLGVAQ